MEQKDSEFMVTFGAVLAVLAILGVIFFFVAGSLVEPEMQTSSVAKNSADTRIEPVGKVAVQGDADSAAEAAAPVVEKTGKELAMACMACHSGTFPGAPAVGNKADWEARLGNGLDAMLASGITGKGAMPPRGGLTNDADFRKAVEHMLAESGL